MHRWLRRAIAGQGRLVLATVVQSGEQLRELPGQKLLLTDSGVYGNLVYSPLGADIESLARQALQQQDAQLHQLSVETGTVSVFVEPFHPVARLLVLGGGHIAQPLVARYPQNPLFLLLAGNLNAELGRNAKAAEYFRQVQNEQQSGSLCPERTRSLANSFLQTLH